MIAETRIESPELVNDPADFVRAAAGCIESRNRLVLQNMPLANWMATKLFRRVKRRRRELVAVGYATLVRIVPKFEPERGYKFSTFASLALHRDMRQLVATDRVVPIPEDHGQKRSEETKAARARDCFEAGGWAEARVAIEDLKFDGDGIKRVDDTDEFLMQRAVLRELLQEVEPRRRMVLELRYIQGLSGPEVAARVQNTGRQGKAGEFVSRKRIASLAQEGVEQLHAAAVARGLTPNWLHIMPESKKFAQKL